MNKCKCGCNRDVKRMVGKKERSFIDDSHRMRYNRTQKRTSESEQIKSEQPKANKSVTQVTPTLEKLAEDFCNAEPPNEEELKDGMAKAWDEGMEVSEPPDEIGQKADVAIGFPVQMGDRHMLQVKGEVTIEPPHRIESPDLTSQIPNYGKEDCECRHCQQIRTNKSKKTLNHGPWKPTYLLAKNEGNRVSLLGDPDYGGICTPEWIKAHPVGVKKC